MPLAAGTRLGPYEILTPIGAGGMGEVYKARDTRLDRIVALKVAQENFSDRFEREARAIAALNHSTICTLHDVGPNYLVMEYIDGAPLSGPLPLDVALKYAMQICDALDAAHRKGITHRDLKPANILVTKAGVKLLDFGLAKFAGAAAAGAGTGDAMTMALTGRNEIVGTLYYMSPEQLQAQATGQEIDARSDIFSFGLVLYEMLTGKRAFDGTSPASVIAAIMERPAPSIGDIAPPALDRVLRTCLAKDPDDRWQTVRDLRRELEWIANAPATGSSVPAGGRDGVQAVPPTRTPWAWIAATAALALLTSGAAFIAYRATRPIDRPLMRFTDLVDAEIWIGKSEGPALALSPDGSRLAYLVRSGGRSMLSLRQIDNARSTTFDGTDDASAPFFSPNGRWIGFFARNQIRKISVEGGAAATICELAEANPRGGGFWAEDGNIYFAGQRTPVMRVPSAGGTPVAVTKLDEQSREVSNRGAQLLPGGEAVLFDASKDNNRWEDGTIQVQSLKSGKRKTLVQGGYFAHYIHGGDASSGTLVYAHGGTLFAAPMDLARLQLTAPGAPVLTDIAFRPENGFVQYAFTAAGSMAFVAGSTQATWSLASLDTAGNVQVLPASRSTLLAFPRLSSDGTRIAVILGNPVPNVSVYDWAQNRMTRLTFVTSVTNLPVAWEPNDRHIAFTLTSSDQPGIYWARADGGGEPYRIVAGNALGVFAFTPDGRRLIYTNAIPPFGIWSVPLDMTDPEKPKAGTPELFLESKFVIQGHGLSPDGRWLAYSASEDGGRRDVFVRPFPGSGGKWLVSTDGGEGAEWSRDGRELLYYDGKMVMAVSSRMVGDSFVAGPPLPWAAKPLPPIAMFAQAPDGKHLIAAIPTPGEPDAARPTHVTFLLNFADELRRKAAAK